MKPRPFSSWTTWSCAGAYEGDVIVVGSTSLLFTERDFPDKQSVLQHYKKAGERMRVTVYGPDKIRSGSFDPGETGHSLAQR